MTRRLYYEDSHLFEFDAVVAECLQSGDGWEIILDSTAFFPEGGGQAADTGIIGDAAVISVRERGGEVVHFTDAPVTRGSAVSCRVDAEKRLRRMQNHSGEHIVSGITHNLYGLNNVGFHMGEEFMTIDFDGELGREELDEIEILANEAVRSDLPVITSFPSPDELCGINYRSKLDLTENVRLVEIQGIDVCACCAPHVSRTGEVGMIKLLDSQRHRGGVRISLVCGMDALDTIRVIEKNNIAVSNLLSARRELTADAVRRLMDERDCLKFRLNELNSAYIRILADSYEETEGCICVFDAVSDEIALRELVNLLMEKSSVAAVFSGNDESGYRYIIGSKKINLRNEAKAINSAISGRGGGRPEMISGTSSASREVINNYFSTCMS